MTSSSPGRTRVLIPKTLKMLAKACLFALSSDDKSCFLGDLKHSLKSCLKPSSLCVLLPDFCTKSTLEVTFGGGVKAVFGTSKSTLALPAAAARTPMAEFCVKRKATSFCTNTSKKRHLSSSKAFNISLVAR